MHLPFFRFTVKILLLISFLITCPAVYAQVKNINGMVVNDNGRLSGAAIRNLRTDGRTESDMQGLFYIKAKPGDTLITNIPNYTTDTLIIGNQDNVIIKLKRIPNRLKEVVIKDSILSPLKVYNNNKIAYKDIYWKGDKSEMLSIGPGTGANIGISINIDKLYNALSKEGKDARKLQRTLTRDYKNNVVDQRFTKSLVGRITGYKGDRLSGFIVKYRPSYEFVSKSNDYELEQYVRQMLELDLKSQK
jgi:hypothetical protein